MRPLLLLSLLLSALCFGAETNRPPHIVLVLADDMGLGDTSACGPGFAETPGLERLAREGTRFARYYTASPICSPSRCGLITGQWPARWHLTSYLQKRAGNRLCGQADFLDPKAPSLPRILREAGYATAHIGKWHLGGGRDVTDAPPFSAYGYGLGLGTYESPEPAAALGLKSLPWGPEASREPQQVPRFRRTAWMVDQAIAFLRQNSGKPCFINLWLDDVHSPWTPAEPGQGPEAARANLRAVIREMDSQVARLMEALPPNTLFIFASDNGAGDAFVDERGHGLRGGKLSLYEGGLRVPFLVRWPGVVPAGRVDAESVLHAVDLLPTFAALAGAALPGCTTSTVSSSHTGLN